MKLVHGASQANRASLSLWLLCSLAVVVDGTHITIAYTIGRPRFSNPQLGADTACTCPSGWVSWDGDSATLSTCTAPCRRVYGAALLGRQLRPATSGDSDGASGTGLALSSSPS